MLGPSLSQQGGVANYEKLFLQYAPEQVQISHIITHQEGSIAAKIWVFLSGIFKFIGVLLTQEVDIVQLEISQRGSAFRQAIMTFIAWIFRKPIIVHAHGSQFHEFYLGLSQWMQQLLSWIFGKCQRFIVLSASWQEFYTNTFGLKPEQVVVLYNPVKVPSSVPHRADAQKVNLLFLGRVGERKGAFDLIRAFSLLPEQQKIKSSLIMAGDGDLETAHNLVKTLNLEDYIKLPGWIGAEARDILLSQANVFILPSYNEGLPLAMLEAMAWELPVIVTPVGGISEIVIHGENGLIVKPGNIEQLSNGINSLIENENFRLSLGSQARVSMIPLDIKKHWESCLDLYNLVLNQKGKFSS
ncbi:glycosyltransferase family 4 protein [Anabaena lutea]|nr:glycosyltransferase family 4 protein [Anabaena lutea]